MSEIKDKEQLIERLLEWQKDPLAFIFDMWGLVPQPLKPRFAHMVDKEAYTRDDKGELQCIFTLDHFEPFEKGKHITWQQWLLMRSVKWGLEGRAQTRIAVESGHGTGKSSSCAMLVIWFLVSFEKAQIPCTAPTQYQLHDILWKEIKLWMDRMPTAWSSKIVWSAGYLRIQEDPETWYARARTARKENPEALAGMHGPHVFFLVDEGSGVPDEVINTAEGSLTGQGVLFIVISNHTRIIGWFHEAFGTDWDAWQHLSFDSEESPIVDPKFVQRMERHGRDSDEFRIRVKGKAPKVDAVDVTGYSPLFDWEIKAVPESRFSGRKRLGVDPAGQGKDETVWSIRDNFHAQVVAREKVSTGKGIAKRTIELMEFYGVEAEEVDLDSFGEGAEALYHLGLAGKAVNGWNVGKGENEGAKSDIEAFINLRAQAYWAFRKWLKGGGELVEGGKWSEQLPSIRYRRTLLDKIQIMPKPQMKKLGYKSPDDLDSIMLTFVRPDFDVIEGEDGEDETVEDTTNRAESIGM